MSSYLKGFSTVTTPQNESIPGSGQIPNSAGGFAWQMDDWARLNRFLVLGAETTYYTSEKKLTRDNAEAVLRCVQADGRRAAARVAEVSTGGLAPKQGPCLFVLAMAAKLGDLETRWMAWQVMPSVVRTGSHLSTFAGFIEQFGGWGKATTRGVGNWFGSMPVAKLAYQAIKYQQRDGWALSDLLRLSHPTPGSPPRNALYKWIVDGELTAPVAEVAEGGFEHEGRRVGFVLGDKQYPGDSRVSMAGNSLETGSPDFLQVEAFELLKKLPREKANLAEACRIIGYADLPRECVPSEWLGHEEVWAALLLDEKRAPRMPMAAT